MGKGTGQQQLATPVHAQSWTWVSQGSGCRAPILAQGQGLPSCWGGGIGHAKATLEGTSPSGKRLRVTLDHDPQHVVFQ